MSLDPAVVDRVRDRLVADGVVPSTVDVARALRDDGVLLGPTSCSSRPSAARRAAGAGPLTAYLRDPRVTDVLVDGARRGVGRPRRRRGAGRRPLRRRPGGTPSRATAGGLLRAQARRRLALRRRPTARRHPRPRGARAGRGVGHLPVAARPATARVHPRRPRRRAVPAARGGALVARGRRGPAGGARHRRHRHGQDHLALDPPGRVRPARAAGGRGGLRRAARPTTRTSCGSRPARPTSRARARSRCATWCASRCGCGPDRIVVGEVRGAEIVDLLAALNTGHEGGCAHGARQHRGRRAGPARGARPWRPGSTAGGARADRGRPRRRRPPGARPRRSATVVVAVGGAASSTAAPCSSTPCSWAGAGDPRAGPGLGRLVRGSAPGRRRSRRRDRVAARRGGRVASRWSGAVGRPGADGPAHAGGSPAAVVEPALGGGTAYGGAGVGRRARRRARGRQRPGGRAGRGTGDRSPWPARAGGRPRWGRRGQGAGVRRRALPTVRAAPPAGRSRAASGAGFAASLVDARRRDARDRAGAVRAAGRARRAACDRLVLAGLPASGVARVRRSVPTRCLVGRLDARPARAGRRARPRGRSGVVVVAHRRVAWRPSL